MSKERKIYVLYENEEWLEPLARALKARGLPHEGMKIIDGTVDLNEDPPPGVFFNRLSASAHTRGHDNSLALGGTVLRWLERHGRRIVNGRNVLDLEMRKFDQYALLQKAGILVPRTVAAASSRKGDEALMKAAQIVGIDGRPFIVKPNTGGKGIGVRLFKNLQQFKTLLMDDARERDFTSPDGVHLVQEYIANQQKNILRNEFIGGKYYYSVQVNTESGFQLCPADPCCFHHPHAGTNKTSLAPEKFTILNHGFQHPLKDKYEAFLRAHDIEVAAIESIESDHGTIYTYDINANTNYNRAAELASTMEVDAYGKLAEFLGDLLKKHC